MMYQFGGTMVKNVMRPVWKTLKSLREIKNEPDAVFHYHYFRSL